MWSCLPEHPSREQDTAKFGWVLVSGSYMDCGVTGSNPECTAKLRGTKFLVGVVWQGYSRNPRTGTILLVGYGLGEDDSLN